LPILRPKEVRSPVTDIYRALADPTRRIILDELCKREGQTLFELCGRLAMAHDITSSRQAVSQHLAVLEEVGLVRTERQSRTKLHWFEGSPLQAVAGRWPIPKGTDRS
jgi:DNA-binding transcriptional ArsR family regulator